MTLLPGPDKCLGMGRFAIIIRIVIMAAFVLGAFGPAMSGAQQPDMDHAQMMSMAGHAASMAEMGENLPSTPQIMLCKQHCLVASAILPIVMRPAEIEVTFASLPRPGVTFAPSRVTPPPGRPPRVPTV